MQDGFHITVAVGEDALPGQSMWGDVVSLLGAANPTTTKNQKLKYVVALDGHRLIFYTQQPTKTRRRDGGDIVEEDQLEGGCTGDETIVLGGIRV
jgi:hypothetical protein